MKRWVVREGDGATVREILARMREGEGAIEEGRVFLGKKRVSRGDAPVRAGDEVRLGAPEAAHAEKAILFVEDGIAATIKPAGIPTVADHAGASHAFVAVVAREIGRPASDLRVTSRLDREVSGVVLFALDAAAETRLREARAAGAYARRYVAVARGTPATGHGVWREPIGRGKDARHRAADGADAKEAETRWRVVAHAGGHVLLALEPVTGRTHQLRVHASHHGLPLLGDRDYGGESRVVVAGGRVVALARIALHCARVAASGVVAEAPIPEDLARAWTSLGGDAEAWEKATSCALSAEPSS
ncbi:MAG TPA: RluA family pseudouridine synthase [Labilithrix sp.]